MKVDFAHVAYGKFFSRQYNGYFGEYTILGQPKALDRTNLLRICQTTTSLLNDVEPEFRYFPNAVFTSLPGQWAAPAFLFERLAKAPEIQPGGGRRSTKFIEAYVLLLNPEPSTSLWQTFGSLVASKKTHPEIPECDQGHCVDLHEPPLDVEDDEIPTSEQIVSTLGSQALERRFLEALTGGSPLAIPCSTNDDYLLAMGAAVAIAHTAGQLLGDSFSARWSKQSVEIHRGFVKEDDLRKVGPLAQTSHLPELLVMAMRTSWQELDELIRKIQEVRCSLSLGTALEELDAAAAYVQIQHPYIGAESKKIQHLTQMKEDTRKILLAASLSSSADTGLLSAFLQEEAPPHLKLEAIDYLSRLDFSSLPVLTSHFSALLSALTLLNQLELARVATEQCLYKLFHIAASDQARFLVLSELCHLKPNSTAAIPNLFPKLLENSVLQGLQREGLSGPLGHDLKTISQLFTGDEVSYSDQSRLHEVIHLLDYDIAAIILKQLLVRYGASSLPEFLDHTFLALLSHEQFGNHVQDSLASSCDELNLLRPSVFSNVFENALESRNRRLALACIFSTRQFESKLWEAATPQLGLYNNRDALSRDIASIITESRPNTASVTKVLLNCQLYRNAEIVSAVVAFTVSEKATEEEILSYLEVVSSSHSDSAISLVLQQLKKRELSSRGESKLRGLLLERLNLQQAWNQLPRLEVRPEAGAGSPHTSTTRAALIEIALNLLLVAKDTEARKAISPIEQDLSSRILETLEDLGFVTGEEPKRKTTPSADLESKKVY